MADGGTADGGGTTDRGAATDGGAAAGYGAIVLAGGGGRRIGGRDKPALPVGGRSMLGRVLDAVADATPRVVVGPARPDVPDDVVRVLERPPGGGPVAATAAGLAAGSLPELVALLAADLPFLTGAAVHALREAVAGGDGAVLVDPTGRRQWLCGVYRVAALRRRLVDLEPLAGRPMRALVSELRLAAVLPPVAGGPPPWYDCDTEDDYRRAEEWA